MTILDSRPTATAADKSAANLTMAGIISRSLANPMLVQPDSWNLFTSCYSSQLSAQFDPAERSDLYDLIRPWADALKLKVDDHITGNGRVYTVKAEGIVDGIEVSVWGEVR